MSFVPDFVETDIVPPAEWPNSASTEFSKMNGIYAQYFSAAPPTRTTVQQFPAAERKPDARDRWPTLEQISIIAVK